MKDDSGLVDAQLAADDGRDDFRAIDAIALTVISACVGINASNMPSDRTTAALIILIMVGLFMHHQTMRSVYNVVYYRQFRRALFAAVLFAPVSILVAFLIGEFVGNYHIGVSLIAGWILMFLFALSTGFVKLANKGKAKND